MKTSFLIAIVISLTTPFLYALPYTCEYALEGAKNPTTIYKCDSYYSDNALVYFNKTNVCFENAPFQTYGTVWLLGVDSSGETGCATPVGCGIKNIKINTDPAGEVVSLQAFSGDIYYDGWSYDNCKKIR